MKRVGLIVMLIAGFAAGIAFVYSCGGGGSSDAALPTSGYVSVPLMPLWGSINLKREYCFDSTPGEEYHHEVNGAYADSSILWNGWMSGETDTSVSSKLYVPIQLPDGATITSLHVVAYDNDPTYDGRVKLWTSGPTTSGTGGQRINTSNLFTDGAANVPRTFTADSIKPSLALVDNLQYSYYLEAKLIGGSDVVLMSAVVGYEFQ